MTADAWQKCGNVRYAITYIWANQKSKSFEYHWLRALAMVWRNELFPPLCRASDVIWQNPSNHGWLTTSALPNVIEHWTEHHGVTAYKASHHCMEADYSQGLRERVATWLLSLSSRGVPWLFYMVVVPVIKGVPVATWLLSLSSRLVPVFTN